MKALFITVKDLKARSIISGSTDGDKLFHFIEVSQDIHIQNYLGVKLYNKMQDLIINEEMDLEDNSDYKLLRDDYIKPMLIWFTQSEYFPFAMFKIDNGGVSKHRGEEADVANYGDIDRMMSKINDRSEFYTRRFLDYICDNSSKYPEYTNNQNGDMYPDKDVDTFSSWVL